MTRKIAFGVIGLVLFGLAGGPATAYATPPRTGGNDLSSLPAIETYLVSIGVDPGSVVVQRGQLNYAGPDCPGADWNCTAAGVVVQIAQIAPATIPAINIFECLPAADSTIPTLQKCVVVQTSALNLLVDNKASCHSESSDGPDQTCTITQSGSGSNSAEIHQRIQQRGPSPQKATQGATIDQTSTGGSNTARIFQMIQQELPADSGSPQQQNARQSATVKQKSSAGDNSSHVRQSLSQNEEAESNGSIVQLQNTDSTLGFNEETAVTQTTDSGNNNSHLVQRLMQHQEAETRPGPVTQTQGNSAGGLKGRINQTINTPNTGVNSSASDLDEDQKQQAETKGTLSQSQTGPEDCCATQSGGTVDNANEVDESSRQKNQQGGFAQQSSQIGHCSEDVLNAKCTVHQTVTQNGTTNHNDCVGPSCSIFLVCSGGVCGGDAPAPLRSRALPTLPFSDLTAGPLERFPAALGAIRDAAG